MKAFPLLCVALVLRWGGLNQQLHCIFLCMSLSKDHSLLSSEVAKLLLPSLVQRQHDG